MAGRLARWWGLAKLSGTMVGARRAKGDAATARAQAHVAARLGELRGLPQKLGQILAMKELDSDKPVYTALTEAPATLPGEEAFELLEQRLGRRLDEVFRQLSPVGIAASLGQVHHGVTLDGTEVAVKIQYPDIAAALDADLSALGWISAPLGGFKGQNLAAFREELRRSLKEELDYRHEAQTLRRMNEIAIGVPGLEIPRPLEELCAPGVLTMTWLKGGSFNAARFWEPGARAEAARTIVRIFLRGLLQWRLLHADPHPGNLRFRLEDGRATIGLLDFGCVREISPAYASAFLNLALRTSRGTLSPDEALAGYGAMGFDLGLLEPLRNRLPQMTRILLEPFATHGPFDARSWKVGARLAEVIGEHRWNFRLAGPPSLIYFIRAYQGVLRYLAALNVPLDWNPLLEEAGASLTPPPPPVLLSLPEDRAMMGKSLRIRVRRDGEDRVLLTFKSHLASQLEDLVPDDILPKLKERGIDLAVLSRQLKERDFPAGEIFTLNESGRDVRVWIE